MRLTCLLDALHARASRCFPCPGLSSGRFLLVPVLATLLHGLFSLSCTLPDFFLKIGEFPCVMLSCLGEFGGAWGGLIFM